MPDDRPSGLSGSSGYIRFNGMDNSGIIPGIPDKKRSRDQHQQSDEDKNKENKDELKSSEYVDRSAQLSATLDSLAMLNVADVLKNKSKNTNIPKNNKQETENKSR
ncbi:MAG: hypothetical protein PHC34_05430 [Candidatus Gastranaerophilales bacterium]|nr:hypothetical protein [Candidatus Gastranaerophilales bacterium]